MEEDNEKGEEEEGRRTRGGGLEEEQEEQEEQEEDEEEDGEEYKQLIKDLDQIKRSGGRRARSVPSEKVMPSTMLKPAMATASSRVPPAMTRVGMPLSVPSPSAWRRSMEGTMMAGDTAEKTNLKGAEGRGDGDR